MKILLTGATGFVGSNILEELVKNNYKVRCLVRKNIKLKNCETVKGDIANYNSLLKAMKDCDVVINLVGIIKEIKRKNINFETIHFLGSKNLIDVAKKFHVKQFIQMSALGTRKNAKSRYHKTKYQAERYLINSGLKYTIFRPSIMFGKQDKSINLFTKIIKIFHIFPIFGSGDYKWQPIYVKDVAKIFVKAINYKKCYNKIFEVGGIKKYKFKELIKVIARLLNKKVIIIKISYKLIEFLIKIFNGLFPINYDQLVMLNENNITNDKKFIKVFKIKLSKFEEKFN